MAKETKKIKLKKVDSSNIQSIGYDTLDNILHVRFKARKGKESVIYQYAGVPPKVYKGLMDAESKGKHFNENIRDTYECSGPF